MYIDENYRDNLSLEYLSGKAGMNTNLTITEICYFVGFGSIVSFARVFRKSYGVTPGNYRRNSGSNRYLLF